MEGGKETRENVCMCYMSSRGVIEDCIIGVLYDRSGCVSRELEEARRPG